MGKSTMPMSTAGESIEGQAATIGRDHEENNASKSSNPRGAIADHSGAVDPLIINLLDDDDNEEENQIVQTRALSELDSSVRTPVSPAKPGDHIPRWFSTPILTFTVQCSACGKWRLVPSREQYHAISERIIEHPWVCEDAQTWRENASCQDPTDLSEDEPDTFWAVDETIIPNPPLGFARKVVVRGERSEKFADVYYRTPCGRQLRSIPDVQRFLEKVPRHKRQGVSLSQFSFTPPKPGPNSQKRAFEKVGKAGKRKGNEPSEAERQSSQPAITDGARSSSRPKVKPNPEPLAMLDPTRRRVPKKARYLSSL
ncbi:hypothetical protein KC19_8G121700 [Ceratodon purpureus]|uniref:Uncharacterized protein n=1 Tax=Ceratodon purpureus TaxID=3225 RepID=A0A8T0GZS9_CERPU|nr:hypothetical protein KC19_8G121700 [Ceratodon purpureus]